MEELIRAVEDLNEDKVIQLVKHKLEEGADPQNIQKQLEIGMTKVGERYEKGTYFIADLIMAGIIFKEAFEIDGMKAKSRKGSSSGAVLGKILLGTVKGDLHDIGKNIFKDMAEAKGFEVYDLGIDVSEDAFVQEVKSFKPHIIGMSVVLTSAIDSIKKTVDALDEAGLRQQVKILVGGLAITEDVCNYVGADGFAGSSTEGIAICMDWRKE